MTGNGGELSNLIGGIEQQINRLRGWQSEHDQAIAQQREKLERDRAQLQDDQAKLRWYQGETEARRRQIDEREQALRSLEQKVADRERQAQQLLDDVARDREELAEQRQQLDTEWTSMQEIRTRLEALGDALTREHLRRRDGQPGAPTLRKAA